MGRMGKRAERPRTRDRSDLAERSSRVFSPTLGKVTLLILTVCYVITLALLPQTIISRATAITVRSAACSPGGVRVTARPICNDVADTKQGFLAEYFEAQCIAMGARRHIVRKACLEPAIA